MGAVDYLFKPFVPDVLLSKVAVFVELYNKRQAIKDAADALRRAYDEMEQRVEERTSELAADQPLAEGRNRRAAARRGASACSCSSANSARGSRRRR